MILQCPKCNARYLVPDSAIGLSGRDVRCARCSHQWHEEYRELSEKPAGGNFTADVSRSVGAANSASSNDIPDLDSILGSINEQISAANNAEDNKASAISANLPVRRDAGVSLGVKLITFIAMLAVILLGVILALPDSAGLKILGMQPSAGLLLSEIKTIKHVDEKTGAVTVEISGNIVNAQPVPHQVPTLRVMLLDEAGNPLQFWEYNDNNKTLSAHESVPFSTGELEVRFTTGKRFVVELGTPLELALRRKP